jgi:hypothetical protein
MQEQANRHVQVVPTNFARRLACFQALECSKVTRTRSRDHRKLRACYYQALIRASSEYVYLLFRNKLHPLPSKQLSFPHISRHNRARRDKPWFPSRPSVPHRSSPHTTLNGSLASRWSRSTAFDRQRHSGRYLGERTLQAVPCTSARLAQTVRQAGLHRQLVGELFTLYPRTSLQLQCFSMSVKLVPPSLLPVIPPAEEELVLLLLRTGCPSYPHIQFLSYVEAYQRDLELKRWDSGQRNRRRSSLTGKPVG